MLRTIDSVITAVLQHLDIHHSTMIKIGIAFNSICVLLFCAHCITIIPGHKSANEEIIDIASLYRKREILAVSLIHFIAAHFSVICTAPISPVLRPSCTRVVVISQCAIHKKIIRKRIRICASRSLRVYSDLNTKHSAHHTRLTLAGIGKRAHSARPKQGRHTNVYVAHRVCHHCAAIIIIDIGALQRYFLDFHVHTHNSSFLHCIIRVVIIDIIFNHRILAQFFLPIFGTYKWHKFCRCVIRTLSIIIIIIRMCCRPWRWLRSNIHH
mmetsp:Transcript_40091/g.65750  ORF Transcript_40091/g.65750 Transcript_40091/m.65750 type:complete len:268 (+) Transcript_40091:316-1119(+)